MVVSLWRNLNSRSSPPNCVFRLARSPPKYWSHETGPLFLFPRLLLANLLLSFFSSILRFFMSWEFSNCCLRLTYRVTNQTNKKQPVVWVFNEIYFWLFLALLLLLVLTSRIIAAFWTSLSNLFSLTSKFSLSPGMIWTFREYFCFMNNREPLQTSREEEARNTGLPARNCSNPKEKARKEEEKKQKNKERKHL